MSFDCSRFTFNSWHDFLGVVMQQGRVQLDADWNEFASQILRRIQVGTLDTFSQPVVPRVTPDGFRIDAVAGELTIGIGRLYIDGLLAENHGATPLQWDPLLAEQIGSVALNYTAQPYYPQPPPLPSGGPHLVYLDVWQREVSHLQYPGLVEKAVGIDTTARLQTVWQVKLLANVGTAVCATPDDEVPGWGTIIAASGARLTTSTGAVADTLNPCLIPPSGGYRGLENQLYRVEIHDGGNVSSATFKWSRDNATVASRVSHINTARDRLTVESLGRDKVLGFKDGDWIEVSDDVRELHGEPGIMARIILGGGVDDTTRTLILNAPLPAGLFPVNAQQQTDAQRNTRVRRWDQNGRVLRADGSLYVDLDAVGSSGLLAVPPAGTALFLENGILVNFDLVASGNFHVADNWSFAARTADASIELLDHAPPRGIHHHYVRLAIVDFPDTESDCRVLWPPAEESAESCACDRCVTPEGHNAGTATLQQAVDALAQTGGVICLAAGLYRLREPLRIDKAGSLRIRGKGWRTLLVTESQGPAMRVSNSIGVTIEHLTAAGAAATTTLEGLIDARNVIGLDLDHLYLLALSPERSASAGVSLGGYVLGAHMRECAVVADVGITGGEREGFLITNAVTVMDSLFICSRVGINLSRRCLHFGKTHIARNLFLAASQAGIQATGGVLPGSGFTIEANVIQLRGDAIVAGVDGLRIIDNEISGPSQRALGNGVVLTNGLDPHGIGHCWITGNRIADMQGTGIAVRTALGSALIKQNIIERMRAGIVFSEAGAAAHLSIENNHLLHIAANFNPESESVVAIQLLATRHADIVGNVISDFAVNALQAPDMVAIRVVASGDIRIASNHLSALGPTQAYRGYAAGIELIAPFTLANIADNIITRTPEGDIAAAVWFAIRIAPSLEGNINAFANALVLTVGREFWLMTSKRLRAFIPKRPNSIAIRGNQAMARGCRAPLVLATGAQTILFSDNHCEAEPDANGRGFAIVMLNGEAVIASQNRVRWTNNDFDAINIFDTKAFTVLGNITMGNIRINGGALPTPWNSLNILAS